MSTDPRFEAADGPPGENAALEPLSTTVLEHRLDYLLNPVLSTRRTAAPLAQALATAERADQEFTLRWVEIISRTNHELAYQFAAAAPTALQRLDAERAEAWIIHAMDTYDRDGLHLGCEVFRHPAAYTTRDDARGVALESVAPVLTRYVCGLSGRRLNIESAPAAWTDTETLYLPPHMAFATTREDNFLLYKCLATLLWAQSRYGTFGVDLEVAVQSYADSKRALAWLNFLETLRLQAQIERLLPGLARDAARLHAPAIDNDAQYAPLRAPSASVHDSLALLRQLDLSQPVPRHPWASVLRPGEVTATRDARIAREKDALQTALSALLDVNPTEGEGEASDSQSGFEAKVSADGDGEAQWELSLNGKPFAPPQPVRELLDSIVQDLGEIPADYLQPAAAPQDAQETDGDLTDITFTGQPHYYPEWDFQRGHYRKHWCVLQELDVVAGESGFVDATLSKFAPQVTQLRRTFELLRGEDKLMKRMKHGDDIDLDAIVAAYSDMRCGMELSERLFVKRHKAERDLAVMFMVDMSGSTKGWINDAEREALVLLTEALEVLGDRYAIYGFSGMTRKRCEIFRIKRFDEPYSDTVRERIAGIAPQDYTRMGAAIRHLTALFEAVDARTKLLITLSDGKPDDYSDNYRGEYGIEDTRKALAEAHYAGIKPFCITIDHEAREYLPHMYGAVNWTLVDDVSRLPFKVADIYRRLTT